MGRVVRMRPLLAVGRKRGARAGTRAMEGEVEGEVEVGSVTYHRWCCTTGGMIRTRPKCRYLGISNLAAAAAAAAAAVSAAGNSTTPDKSVPGIRILGWTSVLKFNGHLHGRHTRLLARTT